ncbi:hypothetical protein [Streptomyces javensis]|uniref:SHOCT domain-containing protein n=1 Tax=Streptomyces javensis TaxID=114698 RepID=A0ABS0R5J6_9ACTN|nr:hypothetical protein [Streptomyces javensis]MBI0312007.1 hypothetical protein [Streptomyces javensis]
MTYQRNQDDYGPHSPDYGLSYDPDPHANPEPIDDPESWESDFHEQDPHEDHAEAQWELAYRNGWIDRDQFARRHQREQVDPAPEAPDPGPVVRSAIEKLKAKLASGEVSEEERAQEEKVLASLERMLKPGE